jgi:hypothetical protein
MLQWVDLLAFWSPQFLATDRQTVLQIRDYSKDRFPKYANILHSYL